MDDQFDLVAHYFQSPVGYPELCPSKYPIEMFFDEQGKLLDGFQTLMACPPEPLSQMGLSPSFLNIVPESLKFFFDIINSNNLYPMGFHSKAFSDISFYVRRLLTSFLSLICLPKGLLSEIPMHFYFSGLFKTNEYFLETNQIFSFSCSSVGNEVS